MFASALSAPAGAEPPDRAPNASSAAVAQLSAPQAAVQQTDTLVRYRVRFRGTWTTDSLASGVSIPSGAHFTTLVGAAHSSGVTFWERGGTATTGIERVAELGITSNLNSEVSTAITATTAREYIRASLGGGPTPTGNDFFDASESYPLVTLISMVAPSPDWFVGVSGLSLREGGEWATSKEVLLYPYDAGTENGEEFSLSNPATNPLGVITSIRNTGKFSDEPLALLIFDRWEPVLSVGDATADEGGTVSLRVTLNRRSITPAQQVTVQYATSGGTATEGTDYTAATGTLTFSTSETVKTVTVQTATDTAVEGGEDFTLTLSSPTNALLLDAEATGTIHDATNQAPQFPSGTTTRSVAENTATGTDFDIPVTATDSDDDTLDYTLGGDDAGSFDIISSSGRLRTEAALDYEDRRSYSITVTATDPDGATDTIAVTISVDNVDEPGEVTLSTSALMGTAVTAELDDPDGSITGTSWIWQRSADRVNWTAVPGAVSAAYTPRAEDVGHYLRAMASYTDGHGAGKTARATTSQRIPNRAPEFGASTAERSVDENTPGGTAFGTAVEAADPDGHTLAHALSGADAGSFDIESDTGQLRTKAALNHEARQQYTVTVSAEDPEGATDSVNVTVRVVNIDEDGTVKLSSGMPAVGVALTARLTDPDGAITATMWTWHTSADQSSWAPVVGAASDAYTPRSSDEGLHLRATASYGDGQGSNKSAAAVSANQVQAAAVPNRAPEFGSPAISRSVDENTPTAEDFGAAVTAEDLDADPLEYALGGTHAGSFDIDTSTGQLSTSAALNYEARRQYTVTVTAEDPGGATDSVSVTIGVVNVDEGGTVMLAAITPMMGTALTATLDDPDGGVTGTSWIWQRSADNTSWTTIGGAVSDSYTPQTADIGNYLRTVASYDDAQGTGKSAQSSWPDQVLAAENQAPQFGSTAAERSVAENSQPGTAVGAPVTADDPENDDLAYSLTLVGSAPFEIDSQTGQIAVADGAGLDFESTRSYSMTVSVSDGKDTMGRPDNSADDTTRVTVRVIDVDDGDPARPSPPPPPPQGGGGVPPPPPPPELPEEFSDIDEAGVHRAAVQSLQQQGLLEGTECAPGAFCPADPILRSTMAVWLVRLLDGADADPQAEPRFSDVDSDAWWAPYVERLAELEVTRGCDSEGTMFCPDKPVNRAQMASFLVRALELPAARQPAGFTDVAADSVHAANIEALHAAAITAGCRTQPALRYCPSRQTTRAQMASFVDRARNHLDDQQAAG